jgi:hypothetical protein
VRYALLLLLGLTAIACSESNDGDNTPVTAIASATVTPTQGATLMSEDGLLTLTVDAGQVSESVEISVEKVEGSDIPQAVLDQSPIAVYEFKPDGLTFTTGATVSVDIDPSLIVADADGDYPAFEIGIARSDGTLDVLSERVSNLYLDTMTATAEAALPHFSYIYVVDNGVRLGMEPGEAQANVGETISISFASVRVPVFNDWVIKSANFYPYGREAVQGAGPTHEFNAVNAPQRITVDPAGIVVCTEAGAGRHAMVATLTDPTLGTVYYYIYGKSTCNLNPDIGSIEDTRSQNGATIVMSLEIGNRYFPRAYFDQGSGAEQGCDASHWHGYSYPQIFPIADQNSFSIPWGFPAENNYPTATLSAITDPMPMNCGFGKIEQVPQKPIVMPTSVWNNYQLKY